MMNEAVIRAEAKLKRIIEREGTADGARLRPEYLSALIAEAEREIAAERFYCI
jgi:hypothetical protein